MDVIYINNLRYAHDIALITKSVADLSAIQGKVRETSREKYQKKKQNAW